MSLTRPRSWVEIDWVETSRRWIESRRALIAWNSTSESLNSVTSSVLRELRTPETFLRLTSSVLIWSSRAARLRERSETPLMAPRNSSGVLAETSASVSSALDSSGMSISSVVLLSSENACTTS